MADKKTNEAPRARRQYSQADFEGDKLACDVVMKGGLTSGVVYPLAVVELAKRYRLENIGGTSAGALAAVMTAAAEHGRAEGGYLRITKIPGEIASDLLSLFQPTPHLTPLFNMLFASLGRRSGLVKAAHVLSAAVRGYLVTVLLSALPGLLVVVWAALSRGIGWLAFGVLLAFVGAMAGLIWRVFRALARELPDNGYGICTGFTQPGHTKPALTDWLAERIDHLAGVDAKSKPLTFGDLIGPDATRPRINLAVMTTNLSMRRPYRLPFRDRIYLFRRSEFERLFPARVVKHMVGNTVPFPADGPPRDDFF